jgi:hypothetical protein
MALLDDVLKIGAGEGIATGLGVGIGVAVAAPLALPVIRTLAKTVIRTGMMVYDQGRLIYNDIAEEGGGLVAEARDEMAARPTGANEERASRRTASRAMAARRAEGRETRRTQEVPTVVARRGRAKQAASKSKTSHKSRTGRKA